LLLKAWTTGRFANCSVFFSACFCEPGANGTQRGFHLFSACACLLELGIAMQTLALLQCISACFCESGASAAARVDDVFSACFCKPGQLGGLQIAGFFQ